MRWLSKTKLLHSSDMSSATLTMPTGNIMETQMRILVIGRNVPTPQYPTQGIFEYNHALALHEQGHEVTYAAVDVRSVRRKRPATLTTRQHGMPAHAISIPLGRVPIRALTSATNAGLQVLYSRLYPRGARPDLIHSHFLGVGVSALALARSQKLPLIHTEHLSDLLQEPMSPPVRKRAQLLYKSADGVLAVSPTLRDVIEREFSVPVVVAPNSIDTSLFTVADRRHKGFRVLTVANLVPIKRIDLAIRAFHAALDGYPGAELTIVGDGPERAHLESLAEELGLHDQVNFTGAKDQQFVADAYRASDVFLLTSKRETFGVVFGEALLSGVPVVTTRCGGPEHFLNTSNSIIVAEDGVNELAAALREVHRNSSRYDPNLISASARSVFSRRAVADRMEAAYQYFGVHA